MNLKAYVIHYLSPSQAAIMLLIAALAVTISLTILFLAARAMSLRYTPETRRLFIRDEMASLSERFYELIFSSTSILLFVSVYFTIDYFGIGSSCREIWNRYNSILLLGFILASVLLNSLVDNKLIPLENVRKGERTSMRLIGMLYMLIIFAYIKFIYNDSNYDSIILYFLTLVFGRFIYFDASLESFGSAIREAAASLPLLVLALICTGLMALYGFSSGYLITSSGVVLGLFIAHLFLLAVIFIIHRSGLVQRLTG